MADHEIRKNDKVQYIGFRVNYDGDSLRFHIGLVDSLAVLSTDSFVGADLNITMRDNRYRAVGSLGGREFSV